MNIVAHLQIHSEKDVFEQTLLAGSFSLCPVLPVHTRPFSIREGVDFTVPNVSHPAMFCYRLLTGGRK